MSALAPCPSCRRHVRTPDGACPFCGQRVSRSPGLVAALLLGLSTACSQEMYGVSLTDIDLTEPTGDTGTTADTGAD